jgi:hypothetical protein
VKLQLSSVLEQVTKYKCMFKLTSVNIELRKGNQQSKSVNFLLTSVNFQLTSVNVLLTSVNSQATSVNIEFYKWKNQHI